MSGDLQNDGNKLLLKQVSADLLACDFFKFHWHGDRNAILAEMPRKLRAKCAFSNYHHKASSGGRQKSYDLMTGAGAEVYTNFSDGEIYVDMEASGGRSTAVVYGSKSRRSTTFTKPV